MFPAVISLFWESQSKEKRENAWGNISDVFAYTGERWQKIWEKPPVEKTPEPFLELEDFDVTLVDTDGVGHGRTHSSVFQNNKHAKTTPGAFQYLRFESPSMDALKYAAMESWPKRKRTKLHIRGAPRNVDLNDTLDMSVDLDLGEGNVPFGSIHFRWDCE